MSESTSYADLPGAYALLLLELVERWGVTPSAMLEGLELSVEGLSEASARITLDDATVLVERAISLTGETGLAFSMGLHMRISSHGYLGFAAMTASTAREALELAIRFAPTRTSAIGLSLHIEGQSAALIFEERVPLGNVREFLILALMVGIAQIAVAATGRRIEGDADLSFAEPPYFARYSNFVPGHVRFNQPSNRLVFDASLLDAPLRMADPVAMKLARDQCERELAALGRDSRELVRLRGLMALPRGFRSLDDTAKKLHVSPRTLKRRLAAQGTSYTAVLDDLRRERALLLLRDRRLSLDEVAERLGYSDVTNFTRAFRRWTGKTPGSVRKS